MKSIYTAAALLAATASADLCAHGSTDDNGNWYCQEVKAITYTGVGGQGSYNKITGMANGACTSSPVGYNGNLSPLDEEVSLHFRGPLELKQFAFYAPATAASSYSKEKRNVGRRSSALERRHGHGHGHSHGHAHLHHARDAHVEDKRAPAVGDMVTAVIDGVTQTWKNTYNGGAAAAKDLSAPSYDAASGGSSAAAPPAHGGSSSSKASSKSTTQSSSSAPSNDEDDDSSSSGTGWTRQGYYNAESGTSNGIVFLNHEGGSGSGVFDYTFGNSLSYASANGQSGASAPNTLESCLIPSGTEVVIMTDDKCGSGDSDCGYYREGTVAYHGFDGPSKAFFFEFSMPDDGTTGATKYDPTNMPAIWLLNAQIPRTLQYGNPECSCWTSGCGEFDIFEVLAPGDKRCKSTLHGNVSGGDSDYFARPTSGTIKAALLLHKDNIHIKILDDSTDFGKTMGDSFISEMIADTMEDSLESAVSIFKLASS